MTVVQAPALNIVKDADVASVDSTSDTITYTYTVTNTGNAAIAGVVVTDDNLTPLNPFCRATWDEADPANPSVPPWHSPAWCYSQARSNCC